MSGPQFTAGPWRLKCAGSILGADGDLVATTGYRVTVGSNEDEANATLITAAPEMCRLLEEATGWLKGYPGPGPDKLRAEIAALLARVKTGGP